MNDAPQTPPGPVPPPPVPPAAPYVPPPLPPGYEQHYRPIYNNPQPRPPANNEATASIVVACGSLTLLIITAGILSPITLVASAIAIPLGHKGKENVDQGKTTQNRDIAVAGFWTGIGGVVLSLIAVIAWIVLIVVAMNSDINWTDGHGQMHHFNFN